MLLIRPRGASAGLYKPPGARRCARLFAKSAHVSARPSRARRRARGPMAFPLVRAACRGGAAVRPRQLTVRAQPRAGPAAPLPRPELASPGRSAAHIPAGVGPRGGVGGRGRAPPRDSGPLSLKARWPCGGGRWGLPARPRPAVCPEGSRPDEREPRCAWTYPSPAAVARETRSRRRRELARLAAPPASLGRPRFGGGPRPAPRRQRARPL